MSQHSDISPVAAIDQDLRRNRVLVVIPGVLLATLAALSIVHAFYNMRPAEPASTTVTKSDSDGEQPEKHKSVERIVDAPFSIYIYAVILAGGIAMVRGRAWSLALTGAILAMLPYPNMYCLTLPIGAWSTLVLLLPGGRAAFHPPKPETQPGDKK